MKILLIILACLGFLIGGVLLSSALTSIHQVFAGTILICSSIMFASAAILEGIDQIPKKQADFNAKQALKMQNQAAADQQVEQR